MSSTEQDCLYAETTATILSRLNKYAPHLVTDAGHVGRKVQCDSCDGDGLNKLPFLRAAHCMTCSGTGALFDPIVDIHPAVIKVLNPPQPIPAANNDDPIEGLANWETIGWAQAVIWLFDPANHVALEPGSFRPAVLNAIKLADSTNRWLLALGFDEAVRMYTLAERDFPKFVAAVEAATEQLGKQ